MIGTGLTSVTRLAHLVRERKLSPVEIAQETFAEIGRLEPELQAWEALDEERALNDARRAEDAVMRGELLGPLHGVPVGVKDIIATAGLRTTMGSPVFKDNVPAQDAAVVARLRGAGAIIPGKTVSTQFAMGDPPRTRNPWDPRCTPGGSSSGSAVAVAAGECPAALGTQTGGSVLRPAAYNGVTGFKPTYGLVSRRGVFPLSWSLDTVGWMCRTVTDAAVLLDVLSAHDSADPASVTRERRPVAPQLVDRDRAAPRLGIVSGDYERTASVEMQAHMFEVIEFLRQGGNWVELFDLPVSYVNIKDAQLVINNVEAAAVHRKLFAERPDDYAAKARTAIECGELVPAPAYVQAQRLRRQFRSDMDEVMTAIDALIMPAAAGPAPSDLSTTGDPAFYSPWTAAGMPAITIPTGISRAGMPLGVQLVGKGFDDAGLLKAALWVEERLNFTPVLPPLAEKLLP